MQDQARLRVKINSASPEEVATLHGIGERRAKLIVDFRDCLDGEVVANGHCDVCVYGSYSLGINEVTCEACPDLANCTNGYQI